MRISYTYQGCKTGITGLTSNGVTKSLTLEDCERLIREMKAWKDYPVWSKGLETEITIEES